MDKRFVTFLILSSALLLANMWVMRQFAPPPRPPQVAGQGEQPPAAQPGRRDAKRAAEVPAIKVAPRALAGAKPVPPEWVTLGSADPESPYRMLVTLTNRGASVERIELSSRRYSDLENLEDRSGYLGHLAPADAPRTDGCVVRVVGAGTPAAAAGLYANDIITAANGEPVQRAADLAGALGKTKPGDSLAVSVRRGGKQHKLTATLAHRPLQVIRPEGNDPLSFLLTLESIDGQPIKKGAEELPGLRLRTSNWQVRPRDKNKPDEVAFEWVLAEKMLKVVKIFRLVKVPVKSASQSEYPAYHLDFHVEIHNLGTEARRVAYRLDGPTGLPTEGWWYNTKISPNWWDAAGARDVVVGFQDGGWVKHSLVSCSTIVDEKVGAPWGNDDPLVYIGVDAQYFACVLIPQTGDQPGIRFAQSMPLRAGAVPDEKSRKRLTNVSVRVISEEVELAASGPPLRHSFQVFAGPKKPGLLAHYGLGELVYYGWFGSVAKPMLFILHGFYALVGSYGLAIIMLTVLVRCCMFPLSRKQALSAQKMQELQPELKRLTEKHKGNVEQRTRAQQELFRKHKYHPLSGCLPALVQLPIFLGLYRSLSVDVELRQAPLVTDAIRWCSNLAAPDMFWYWEAYLPAFLAAPTGWLGPYLNLLPLVTIGLFIWQQKMFMPPPADEQAAMQQKIMQYMMIFMGVLFFKVASGLCVYFIASSLWGIAERKLLPKVVATQKPPEATPPAGRPAPAPRPSGNGLPLGKKKRARGRK